MPLYEYKCEEHGAFEKILPLSRSSETVHCPTCESVAAKVFTMPVLRGMSKTLMSAHERNERSREAPHICRSGCTHHHKTPKKELSKNGEPTKPKLQSYQGKRPWVIEHA